MADKQNLFYVKPFDGTSFSNWEFRVTLLLEQQGVKNVITEDPPSSTEVDELEKYRKNEIKARTVIIQCVADNILETLKTKTSAKEIMESLKNTYANKGIANQVILQRKLRGMKYNENKSLTEYLTEFEQTVCELKSAGSKIEDNELVLQLLSSMPESYQTVTTAIDIMFSQNQNAIDMDFVKNKLLLEEARQSKSKPEVERNVAFMGSQMQRGFWRGSRRGISGNFRGNYNSNAQFPRQFPFNCHLCNQAGHKRSQCPKNQHSRGNLHQGRRRGNWRGYDRSEFSQEGAHSVQQSNVEEDISQNISFITLEENNALITNEETTVEVNFIVDSGATNHLVGRHFEEFLFNGKVIDNKIHVAKAGQTMNAIKEGNLNLNTSTGKVVTLNNVWVCENLNYNLLSVKKMQEFGLQITFSNGKVLVLKNGNIILSGTLKGNLYVITFLVPERHYVTVSETDSLMHRRMGHSSKYPAVGLCEICQMGKQTHSPYRELPADRKAKNFLEIISSDVCGPITPMTFDGKSYFVTFIDQFSHFSVVYLLSHKSEVEQCFKNYLAMAEAKFNRKIQALRCDNGGEYSSQSFKKFCLERGIRIQYTVPYNPQQNGVAERYNRTIMEKARCLIYDAKLDNEMWGEAVRTSVYLINRLQTRALDVTTTPAELWYGYKPNFEKIKLFGCPAYNFVPKEIRKSKLDQHTQKLIMIGYADNGYRLYDKENKKIITGRNVVFEENYGIEKVIKVEDENNTELDNNNDIEEKENINQEKEKEVTNEVQQIPTTRKSNRKTKLPGYLENYILDDDIPDDNQEEYNLFTALSVGHLISEVPQSYKEAIEQDKEWKIAIQNEIRSLEENETWELVVPPKDAEIIDSKWVFREKEVDGSIVKKARLVARGFKQSSIFEDVYSPVVRMPTIRLLLSLLVEYDLMICQMDVTTAFLNGTLNNPVYMLQPKGLKNENKNLVCKLKKALYGLKQSPKCWNTVFNNVLMSYGFQRSMKDPCLYFTDLSFILIHVDDLLILSKTEKELNSIKFYLCKHFKMKELSNKNIVFLGLEIVRLKNELYISQRSLVKKVLQKFNMLDCKTSNVPMQPKLRLRGVDTEMYEKYPYRELLGCLMYIMLGSRPDLCFSITYFSQFQTNYSSEHWNYLKFVLRYLKLTKDFSLKYTKSQASNAQISLNSMILIVKALVVL